MTQYYSHIVFYRYEGDDTARAFQFNNPKMVENAVDLGCIILGIYKANGYARSLCSQVNHPNSKVSIKHYWLLVKEHKPGQLLPDIFLGCEDD